MLKLTNIQFQYGQNRILKDVTFSLKKGEIGSIIGASGTGKTTIFKLLTGLLKVQTGDIKIGVESVPQTKEHIACMMQDDLLLPWRTIVNNLLLLKELGKKSHSNVNTYKKAVELLDYMGLSNTINMYPHELSHGMKQRVSLARALLQERPILLLDEPFGSLDVALREHMYTLLRQIQGKHETTMLMVTHDFRDALSLSDHIFFLCDGIIKKKWKVSKEIRNNPAASGLLLENMRHAIMGL
jgi:ABC-type nitrate/sulfonate/bicarbonate transport system ATPase subunit